MNIRLFNIKFVKNGLSVIHFICWSGPTVFYIPTCLSAESYDEIRKACNFPVDDACNSSGPQVEKDYRAALVKTNERPLTEQVEELKVCVPKGDFTLARVIVDEGEGYQTVHNMCYRNDGSLALYAFFPDYSSHSMQGANKNYKGELFIFFSKDGKVQNVNGKKTVSYIEMKKKPATTKITRIEDKNFDSFRIKPVMHISAMPEMVAKTCLTKFSSVYTDLKADCPESKPENDEGDPTHTCKSIGPYHAYIYYSALGTFVHLEEGEKTVLRLPEQGHDEIFKRKIEWRLADGKPFAIIYRVAVYSKKGLEAVSGSYMQNEFKIGEKIIVRGLKEYSAIETDLDTKVKNVNENAHKITDQVYCSKK